MLQTKVFELPFFLIKKIELHLVYFNVWQNSLQIKKKKYQ